MMAPHGVDPAFGGTHGGNDDKVGNNSDTPSAGGGVTLRCQQRWEAKGGQRLMAAWQAPAVWCPPTPPSPSA